jgi:hypothetical protein
MPEVELLSILESKTGWDNSIPISYITDFRSCFLSILLFLTCLLLCYKPKQGQRWKMPEEIVEWLSFLHLCPSFLWSTKAHC